MSDLYFADPKTLLLGALTGFIFGFLLHKSGVADFKVIVGQFLLKDFTMLKVMLTAISVGAIGIYGMRQFDIEVTLHIKTAALFGNILGGILFGIGMVMLGYCPGTGVAAAATGSRHAIFGLLGMLVGAAAYAEVYPLFKTSVLESGNFGKVTFDSITGISPWVFIHIIIIGSLAIFYLLKKIDKKPKIYRGTGESKSKKIKLKIKKRKPVKSSVH